MSNAANDNCLKDLGNMVGCSKCCTTHKNAGQCPEVRSLEDAKILTSRVEIALDDIVLEGL